jgi:hypothetical protein
MLLVPAGIDDCQANVKLRIKIYTYALPPTLGGFSNFKRCDFGLYFKLPFQDGS